MPARRKPPKSFDEGAPKRAMSKSETKRREDKLKMNLHLAEIGQVEDYIKSRSIEIDKEIEDTRQRMNLSLTASKDYSRDKSVQPYIADEELSGGRDEASTLSGSLSRTLQVDGEQVLGGRKKVKRHTTNSASNGSVNVPSSTREVEWQDLKDRLLGCLADSGMTRFQVTETFLPSELAREKEIFIILEEVLDVFQIDFVCPLTNNDKDLLLHFHGDRRGSLVNIKELLMDLDFWDTHRSRHADTRIRDDERDLDLDQGLPDRFKHSTYGGHTGGHKGGDRNRQSIRQDVERLSTTNPETYLYPITEHPNRLDANTLEVDASDASGAVADKGRTNTADALADIHALVHASTGNLAESLLNFSDNTESTRGAEEKSEEKRSPEEEEEEEEDERMLEQLRRHAEREKRELGADPVSLSSSDKETVSGTATEQARGGEHRKSHDAMRGDHPDGGSDKARGQEVAAENIVTQLAEENKRLKRELGAFDAEFFEELEDLKFKYATLQDTVGDTPVIRTEQAWNKHASARLAGSRSPHRSPERWTPSAENGIRTATWAREREQGGSSRAVDRARLTSSLTGSRPAAHREEPHNVLDLKHTRSQPIEYGMSSGEHATSWGDIKGRGIGYRPSKTIDGHALKRSIKEQVHGSGHDGNQDDYGSLCERRLVFELKNLSNPSRAAGDLVRWVMEQSHMSPDHVGFVSCEQLHHILVRRLGLKMSEREVNLLAMGFASDGSDHINAEEFTTALKSLLHTSAGEGEHAETEEEAVQRLAVETIRNLSSDLLTHKKFTPLLQHRREVLRLVESRDESGLSEEIERVKRAVMEAVSRPFYLMDDNRNGIITAKGFTKIIHFFSPGISDDEVSVLVSAFRKSPSADDYRSRENDFITEYRSQQLKGSLRGAASGSGGGDLNHWLQQSLPGHFESSTDIERERKQLVVYIEFLHQLAEAVVGVVLDIEDGSVPPLSPGDSVEREGSSGLPPLITGFGELLDSLLSHLESMSSSRRRQCLIKLHTTLSKQSEGEGHAEGVGHLDGFAVLKALVTAGFPLERTLRAKFLRDVEELSGGFNFIELCRFLMSSCCDWSTDERQVMSKVLQAMGVTTEQRRQWLAQLKKDLCLASEDYKINSSSRHSAHPVSLSSSKRSANANSSGKQNWQQLVIENLNDGVPASTFLHCLRESGVHLSVDDEATLLDCLDFEAQAMEMGEEESVSSHEPLMNGGIGSRSDFSVSLIKYHSFLSICARHTGKWYQASPILNNHLKNMLMDMPEADVTAGIKEFKLLLKTFDAEVAGRVGFRPFLISCRRSRVLSRLEPDVVTELAKVLAEEGSGEVAYETFLLHLKSLYHQVQTLRLLKKEVVEREKSETYELFGQLVAHGTDKTTGTLRPLRRWILNVTEKGKSNDRRFTQQRIDSGRVEPLHLSRQHVSDLLRDFNVVHSPEDLETFTEDIQLSSAIHDYFSETDASPLHYHPSRSYSNQHDDSSINPSNLLHCLLQHRPSWALRHPKLVAKIRKLLSRASTSSVQTLISRLRSFARYTNRFRDDGNLTIDLADDEDNFGDSDFAAPLKGKQLEAPSISKAESADDNSAECFITKEAFSQVISSVGLKLSEGDLDFLADESDASVQANRIRVGILLEALSEGEEVGGVRDVLESAREQMQDKLMHKHVHSKHGDSKSTRIHGSQRGPRKEASGDTASPAVFAITHLQTLLLNSAHVLKRSMSEWSCDVLSLMDGFDRGGGVCTPQDFILGLKLLSVRLSGDILGNLPRISKSVDMIPYKKLLEVVFSDSFSLEQEGSGGRSGATDEAVRDLVYGVGEDVSTDLAHSNGHRTVRSGGRGRDRNHCPSAVQSLIKLVRKRLNLFLAGDKADAELAHSTLVSVFAKFDSSQEHFISPRNFCLAVSVLMDGDVPLLTKADWEKVVQFFQQSSVVEKERNSNASGGAPSLHKRRTGTSTSEHRHATSSPSTLKIPPGMVHYPSFVRLVLDSSFAPLAHSTQSAATDRSYGHGRGSHVSSSSKPRAASTGRLRGSLSSSTPHSPNRSRGTARDRDMERPSYQPMHRGVSASKKKPKSYIKSNRLAMSARPAMFRADYDEDEEENEYAQSNTLSGRGVVGACSSDRERRSNLSRVNAPRVESRYSAYDLIDDEEGTESATDLFSHSQLSTGGGDSKSVSSLRHETNVINDINRQLNGRTGRQLVDYTQSIRELNDELHNTLSPKAHATRGKSSMCNILRTHLQMEDKNNSGTLSKHSTLAALNGLGVVYHFWSKPSQKQLIEALMAKSKGVVNIEDFMNIVYLP